MYSKCYMIIHFVGRVRSVRLITRTRYVSRPRKAPKVSNIHHTWGRNWKLKSCIIDESRLFQTWKWSFAFTMYPGACERRKFNGHFIYTTHWWTTDDLTELINLLIQDSIYSEESIKKFLIKSAIITLMHNITSYTHFVFDNNLQNASNIISISE